MKYLFFILLIVQSAPVQAGRYLDVCPTCLYSRVQAAVQAAQPGDTLRLLPGTYREAGIRIDKPLCLSGWGMPVIDGGFTDEIITIDADSVQIEGIEFRNSGRSHIKDLAAIRVRRRTHFTLRNNRIINAQFGIYIEKSKSGLIENNILLGQAVNEMTSGNAIHCWYAERLHIRNNYTHRYRDGIYLEFVDSSEVLDNVSEANIRYGLHFMFSNDNHYACNTFRNNGAGVAVMFSKRISMLDNIFEYNWGQAAYGLLLKEIYDAEIRGNHFRGNTIGILLEGSTRIRYTQNEFRSNGWAVQMSGGCLDNEFTRNNFQNNTLDLVVNSRINNNTFNGNFWSEYSGYDLDRDGIGDIPHRPVKLYSYVLSRSPESIVLLRSFFIDLLNFSEKVSPVFTPDNVLDHQPLMQAI